MGTFAKIFIVVNLVLAVVFLGAASSLLGTIEDYKGKWSDSVKVHDDYVKTAKAKVKQLDDDIDSMKTKIGRLENENSRLESADKQRNLEWSALEKQYNGRSEQLKALASKVDDLQKDLEKARQSVESLNGKYETALADTRTAKQGEDDLRNDLERANQQLKRVQADLATCQKEKATLSEADQKKARLIAQFTAKFGTGALAGIMDMPAVNGQVTGVDEDLNIVLVSVGTDDDMEVGFTMTVFRGGEFVGNLIIDKVGQDWASGHMDRSMSKSFPVKGDQVATQL